MLACLFNNKTSESWVWALRDGCAHGQMSVYVHVRSLCPLAPLSFLYFLLHRKGLGT